MTVTYVPGRRREATEIVRSLHSVLLLADAGEIWQAAPNRRPCGVEEDDYPALLVAQTLRLIDRHYDLTRRGRQVLREMSRDRSFVCPSCGTPHCRTPPRTAGERAVSAQPSEVAS